MKLYKAINKKTKKVCYLKCKCGLQNEIRNQTRIGKRNDQITELQKELTSGDKLFYSFLGDFKKESLVDKKIAELGGIVINIEDQKKDKKK